MKQPKQFTIDGVLYTVAPFPTTYGLNLFTELVLLFGEPAFQLALQAKDQVKGEGGLSAALDMDIKPESITAIFSGLTRNLTPEKVDDIFKRILRGTLIGNTGATAAEDFDTRFSGKYLHLMKVIAKSLEGQFGDFLEGLGGKGKAAQTIKP